MSDRHTSYTAERTLRVSRLAAQLAREDAGLYRTLDEIARDAEALIATADRARKALEANRPEAATSAYAKASRLLKPYRARTVPRGDLAGMVLGVRFTSARFSSGADHVFPLS